jgi:hypothetical protein
MTLIQSTLEVWMLHRARPSRTTLLRTLSLAVTLSGLATACRYGGDIRPGVGAAGIKLGDSRSTVEKALGKPEQETASGVSGEKRKETAYLLYPARGLDVLLEEGKVKSIFLYHEGTDDHREYPGRMNGDLTLSSKRSEILHAFGEPSSRGIGADADRWYRYDSGIEFSFQPDGTPTHIVITAPR